MDDIQEIIKNPNKDELRKYKDNFGIIISKIPEDMESQNLRQLLHIIVELLFETKSEKDTFRTLEKLIYFENNKLSVRMRKETAEKNITSEKQLLFNAYHNISKDDLEYADLKNAYYNEICENSETAQEMYELIIRNNHLEDVVPIIDKINLSPDDLLFHSSINRDSRVIDFICDHLISKDITLNDESLIRCRGQANAIRKIGTRMKITEAMAGRAINAALYHSTDNLVDLIAFFKEKEVNVSEAIREDRDWEQRSAIDNACWNPSPDHLPILISNVTDDDLRTILTTSNYARRTPLGHANYYNHTSCIEMIEKEMTRLGIALEKRGVLRVITIDI